VRARACACVLCCVCALRDCHSEGVHTVRTEQRRVVRFLGQRLKPHLHRHVPRLQDQTRTAQSGIAEKGVNECGRVHTCVFE
jgi:hypothetical protein